MGQYYTAINLTKRQYAEPWTFDNGAKLMEHSWVGNTFVESVMILLSTAWKNDEIVWAGDYADHEENIESNLYSIAGDNDWEDYKERNYENLSTLTEDEMIQLIEDKSLWVKITKNDIDSAIKLGDLRYIVNHTENMYVDIKKTPPTLVWGENWQIHPLSLLTCEGNGRGGGDYRQEDDGVVGMWARHSLETFTVLPDKIKEKYTEFKFNLTE